MRLLITTLWVVTVALVASACSNDTDDSPNIFPDSSATKPGPDTSSAGTDVDVSGCTSCLKAGDWYKFTMLKVTSVCGDPNHGAIATLQTLWAADITKNELAIVFEIVSAGDQLVVKARSAARNPAGGICLVPGTESDLTAPQTS